MHISPVSSRGNEVETDMDATVLHCLSDHSTLCVEKLFKQRVDVLCDWLPAKRRRRRRREEEEEEEEEERRRRKGDQEIDILTSLH